MPKKSTFGWNIPREGHGFSEIDFKDLGFWLSTAINVNSLGGTYELRQNPDTKRYEIRNTEGKFRWVDRIDSNANRADPTLFYLAEKINAVAEWITGADFPVHIDWEDNRKDVRDLFPRP